MTDRIAEIRALLADVTPWPQASCVWYGSDRGGWAAVGPHHTMSDDDDDDGPGSPPHVRALADARFLDMAPELLVWAVVEIERLREREAVLGALLEAERLLATPSAEVSRLRHVQSSLRDWAQGRVETLARCIATDGVASGTKAEMMYERTIMRDIVAMLDEATT